MFEILLSICLSLFAPFFGIGVNADINQEGISSRPAAISVAEDLIAFSLWGKEDQEEENAEDKPTIGEKFRNFFSNDSDQKVEKTATKFPTVRYSGQAQKVQTRNSSRLVVGTVRFSSKCRSGMCKRTAWM